MMTIELDDDLYALIETLAKQRGISPSELIQQILRSQQDLLQQELPDSQRNWDLFHDKLPELLQTHAGEYVAIANCQVVGFGRDRIALLKAMRAQYGRIHILVTEVASHLRTCHIPYRRTTR